VTRAPTAGLRLRRSLVEAWKRFSAAKLLAWALAIAALAFVVSSVPVRDRCWDPRAPGSTPVGVTRDSSGWCVKHLAGGEVRIGAQECNSLRCEPGLASTLVGARPLPLLAIVVLYGVSTLVWSARWRSLLGFADVDISLAEVWRLSIEAQAGGVLLPGGLGGDAFRVASVVAKPGVTGAKARTVLVIASVLLDRAVGLAVIAAVASVGAFVWAGRTAGSLAFTLACIPVAFVAGIVAFRVLPLDQVPALRRGRLGGVVAPLLDYIRDARAPRAIATAAVFGFVLAVMQYAEFRGLVFALGAEPTAEKWIPLGIAMGFLVGAIPALPGGWGTADAAYVYFFGLAGLSAGQALGVSLLFRLLWYVSAVVGAALYLRRSGKGAVAVVQGGAG
jgi:uncharacterized membrane protein YbhN (UPF0104 family)